jgi:glycosyltransferase involved in cell wall biosynthesis
MNLCYVCPEYPPLVRNFGGLGVILQFEAEWFARHGHSVKAVCQTSEKPVGQYQYDGVSVEVIAPSTLPKLGAIWGRMQVARSVRRCLGRSPGVVVCADYGGHFLMKPARQPLAVHMQGCASLHALQQGKTIHPKTRFFERRTVQCADGVRAASAFASRLTLQALNIPDKQMVVIPNPVDTSFFSPNPSGVDTHEILFVGKLCELKGLSVLGRAIGEVFERVPKARLVMVGHDTAEDGKSTKERFLSLVAEKHRSRIEFIERLSRAEVAARIRQAGVLVLPSYAETFPLVVLEAMACGRPVVASNRGGIPEAVEDDRTGLLADPSRPESFTKALLELLQQSSKADAMGQEARRVAETRFSPDAIFSQLREFYEDLLKKSQLRSVSAASG